MFFVDILGVLSFFLDGLKMHDINTTTTVTNNKKNFGRLRYGEKTSSKFVSINSKEKLWKKVLSWIIRLNRHHWYAPARTHDHTEKQKINTVFAIRSFFNRQTTCFFFLFSFNCKHFPCNVDSNQPTVSLHKNRVRIFFSNCSQTLVIT